MNNTIILTCDFMLITAHDARRRSRSSGKPISPTGFSVSSYMTSAESLAHPLQSGIHHRFSTAQTHLRPQPMTPTPVSLSTPPEQHKCQQKTLGHKKRPTSFGPQVSSWRDPPPPQRPRMTQEQDDVMRGWRDEDDGPTCSTPHGEFFCYFWLPLPNPFPPCFAWRFFHSHYFCCPTPSRFCVGVYFILFSILFPCPFAFRMGRGFFLKKFHCLCPAPFAWVGFILYFINLLPTPSHRLWKSSLPSNLVCGIRTPLLDCYPQTRYSHAQNLHGWFLRCRFRW